MNAIFEDLKQILKRSPIDLSDSMINQFVFYTDLLIEWNKKMNLTSIIKPEEIAIKHFLDSLLTFDAYKIPQNAKVLDVGTGAGFPGVPLKIARPDLNLTLLDSLNKRLIFLQSLLTSLNINADLVHERAESAAKQNIFREKFDLVISRAVAPLNILLEYCIPFVCVDGVFIAMKGSNAESELDLAQNAIKKLNIKVILLKKFTLIDKNDRSIIVFKKLFSTENFYPRKSSKILKKPL